MADSEELRLRVVLEDQASGELGRIRDGLAQMGGGQQAAGMERVSRGTREITALMRPLAAGTVSARSAMSGLGLAMGGVGVAVAGLGYAFYNGMEKLAQFSRTIIELKNTADVLGVEGGVLNNIVKQFEAMGIARDAAIGFASSFTTALADISREGSELRQRLMQGTTDPNAMANWLGRMTGFANRGELEGAINEFVEGVNNAFDAELRRTGSRTMAADLRNNLLRAFGVDAATFAQIKDRLTSMTDEEKAQYDQRLRNAREFDQQYRQLSQNIKGFWDSFKDALLPAFTELNAALALNTTGINEWGTAFGTWLGTIIREVTQLATIFNLLSQGEIRQAWQAFREMGQIGAEAAVETARASQQQRQVNAGQEALAAANVAQMQAQQERGQPVDEQAQAAAQAQLEQARAAREAAGVTERGVAGWGRRLGSVNRSTSRAAMRDLEYRRRMAGEEAAPATVAAEPATEQLREIAQQTEEQQENTEALTQQTEALNELIDETRSLSDAMEVLAQGEQIRLPEPAVPEIPVEAPITLPEAVPEIPVAAAETPAAPAKRSWWNVGGIFGNRQFGGPVESGLPYLVGEQGPEVMVPDQSGDVLAAGAAGGGGEQGLFKRILGYAQQLAPWAAWGGAAVMGQQSLATAIHAQQKAQGKFEAGHGYGQTVLAGTIPGYPLLEMMHKDAQTGHPLRTKLRALLGIEDPGEPAPWQQGGILRPDTSALDQTALDDTMAREITSRVEGTGTLSVDVTAPPGTRVEANGEGLFKKTIVRRQTQMEMADIGPAAWDA